MHRLRRNEAGVSLLAVVLAMGVLGFLGATFADLVVQQQYAAVNEPRALQALYLAEAGFELAIQELLDNQDYAFNGAAANGVIGGITNVPLGAGTVSVSKGGQTPPVLTVTGTVGEVSRVIAMTLDVKNLVKKDPTFDDAANLATNWPEAPPTNINGDSTIQSNALRAETSGGKNLQFTSYREQVLDQAIPAGSLVGVRLSYKRDRTGAGNTVNKHTLELRLVTSGGSTQTPWSVGPGSVSDADKNVWLTADIRGWPTSSSASTTKVRLFYDLGTGGAASNGPVPPPDLAFGWFDNVQVNIVSKSAWSEP